MNGIPLGIGNPEDPLYGVLDIEQNFFYLVSCHQSIVEHGTNLLKPHKSVRLEIISDAVNYHHTLIDNYVCMNWGIESNPEKLCVNRTINHTTETKHIIDKLILILSVKEKIHNFQQTLEDFCRRRIGMSLPDNALRRQFVNDEWFNLAMARETTSLNQARTRFEQDLNEIESVFDLDIVQSDYKAQIQARMCDLPIEHKFKKIFYEF